MQQHIIIRSLDLLGRLPRSCHLIGFHYFTQPFRQVPVLSLVEISTFRAANPIFSKYQRTSQFVGEQESNLHLHHLSSYKGGALPIKLFPYQSFKNLVHPAIQYIVMLNAEIQARYQNNRCYHILNF